MAIPEIKEIFLNIEAFKKAEFSPYIIKKLWQLCHILVLTVFTYKKILSS